MPPNRPNAYRGREADGAPQRWRDMGAAAFVMMALWALAGGDGSAARAAGQDADGFLEETVDFPRGTEDVPFRCHEYAQTVFVRQSGAVDPREFAARLLEQGRQGLFVLGASREALWVVEAIVPVDACDSVDCLEVELREIRFDGRRISWALGDDLSDSKLMPNDQAAATLRGMKRLSGDRVWPVKAEVNRAPELQVGPLSDWVMRVRDSLHRKTYLWRVRNGNTMCWCTSEYVVATMPWS